MATLLDTVQRFRKIEEATANKDDPAPVFLLDEIAELSRASPESAQAIADAVQKKLGARSPVVKFKALRIIKHLCLKGCSQFQRCMQRHSASVRELIHFRGEPDPFKGDVPNARVREFAKEVTEVLFNATPAPKAANTLAAQGKIQGFGSAGPDASSSGSGHYGGIGSSGIGSAGGPYGGAGGFRGGPGANGGMGGGFAAAQQAASQLTAAAQQALGDGPIAAGIASAANALGGLLQPAGYGSRLNEPGSGYNSNGNDGGYAGFSASGSSYAAPSVSHVAASQVLGSEEALVGDITTPGGLRPLPDAADLRRFVDTASSMDGLRLGELLRDKMESPRWQVVLRSLAALQALLQRGSSQACGEAAVLFQSDPSPVRAALASPQPQVQALAAAVLKQLTGEEVALPCAAGGGGGSSAAAKKPAAVARQQQAAPLVDLLIDDSPAPAPAAAPASDLDLLGDLAGPPAAAAAPAAAPAAAAAGGGDLFGGLEVAAAPGAAAAAAQAPAPSAAPGPVSSPLDELFSGLTTNSSSSAPAAAAAAAPPASSSNTLLPDLLLQPGAQPLQQQQQQQRQQPQQQQQQVQDLLGDLASPQAHNIFSSLPQQQQQQQQQHQGLGGGGLLGGGMPQFNGLHQQPAAAAAHLGAAPQWGGAGAHAKAPLLHAHHGPGGAAAGGSAWRGNDDVSNLMRQISSGGKSDPAFDFVSAEFSKKR